MDASIYSNRIKTNNASVSFLNFLFILVIIASIQKTLFDFFPAALYNVSSVIAVSSALILSLVAVMYFSKALYENRFFYIFLLLIVYMLFIGMLRSSFYSILNNTGISILFAQDLYWVFTFAVGAVYANKQFIETYIKAMMYLGVFSIICGIAALILFSYSDAMSYWRGGGIWSKPYYLWWMTYATFAFTFAYSRITGKYKLIGYSLFILYLVLGILFLKRSTIIECATLLVATSVLKKYENKRAASKYLLKLALIFGAICVVAIIFALLSNYTPFFKVIFDRMYARFTEEGSLFSYNRTGESTKYLNNTTLSIIITGNGIGNFDVKNEIYSIHIGYINNVFKGGLLYSAFWVITIIKTVIMYFHKKKLSDIATVCLCVTSVVLVDMIFAFSWSYTIGILGFATSVIYVMQYDLHLQKERKPSKKGYKTKSKYIK